MGLETFESSLEFILWALHGELLGNEKDQDFLTINQDVDEILEF